MTNKIEQDFIASIFFFIFKYIQIIFYLVSFF